tara:strand:- start:576 stop:1451 length:876 start_codon:yes stop_codon:yes gene_type:complete
MKLSDREKGTSFALLGILFITPDSLLVRLISLESWELIFFRGLLPFFFLLILLLIYYQKKFFEVCLLIGFAGILNAILLLFGNITFIMSLENTNVANTLVIISLGPFISAILSSIFLKEHPNMRTWIVILLCFSFILFIFYDSFEGGRLFGDLMALATAFLVGASTVIIRYAKIINFLPSLLLAKLLIATVAYFFIQEISFIGLDIYFIFAMTFFCVFLSFTLLTLAPRYIPAHEVQLFFILETILGPIWVWFVIKEQPTTNTIIGGLCIILLIFYNTIQELKSNKINSVN